MVSDFLDLNGKWQCTHCGACCLQVQSLLPEFALPGGRCLNLMNDNHCAIYERRPSVCHAWPAPVSDREMAEACDLLLSLAKNT